MITILLHIYAMILLCRSQDQEAPVNSQGAKSDDMDTNITVNVEDENHLKEHIKEMGAQVDVDKMTPEEKKWFFFKIHDFDNNNKLDGIELYNAVYHGIEESVFGRRLEVKDDLDILWRKVERTVNKILKKDDKDNDGYVSYPEYAIARKVLSVFEVQDDPTGNAWWW